MAFGRMHKARREIMVITKKEGDGMAKHFEKINGVCFEIVWTWNCEGALIVKVENDAVSDPLWVEDVIFDNEEQAAACLKGTYRIALYCEEKEREDVYLKESNASMHFDENLGLYELADTEGRTVMLRLVPKFVAVWKE
jgi:hypothetical protein